MKDFELPKHWKLKTIEDVCEQSQYGYTTKSSLDGDVKFLRTTDISSNNINWKTVPYCLSNPDSISRFQLKTGDVVISRAGTIGISALISDPPIAVFASYLIRFRPKINPKYFYYFLQSPFYWSYVHEHKVGIAVQNLNATKIKSFPIPLPPEDEQEKVVLKIESLFSEIDAGMQHLNETNQKLELYKQSIFVSAIRGEIISRIPNDEPASVYIENIKAKKQALVRQGKLKNEKANSPTAAYEMPFDLPLGWEWVRLGTLIYSIQAGKSFKCEERPPLKGEIGVVKVSAVTWGEYDEGQSKTCINKDMINPDYFIQNGDFLFSRANTIELVGAAVIVNEVNLNVMLSDKILRLHFIDNEIKSWVLLCLRSRYGRSQIQNNSTGNQDSMRNIGQDSIKNILIPMPSKCAKDVIMRKFEFLMIEKNKINENLVELYGLSKKLKQTILKTAFEGKFI